MDMTFENQMLDALRLAGQQIFIPSYLEDAPREVIQAEALGILIARIFGWDGEAVGKFLLRALYAGLEDANWHRSAGVAYDWVHQMEAGTSIDELLKA